MDILAGGDGPAELRQLELNGEVGLDSLPYQLMKRSIHEGFVFNILCVGESGIGKSTLMCSLFNNNDFDCTPSSHFHPELKLKTKTYSLQELCTDLTLTVIETEGYGDQIDKGHNFQLIVDYIDDQFEYHLQEELKIKRSIHTHLDTRVHVCFYFIAPSGRGLKYSDVVCLKSLHHKVNIVLLIAKSDIIMKEELEAFKRNINNELAREKINIYCFPFDEEVLGGILPNNISPFAVIGSRDFLDVEGESVRCRCYPWGTVFVEDERHSDFVYLRTLLMQSSLENMRETTHNVHYELFRQGRLKQMTRSWECGDNTSLTEFYRQEREWLRNDLKAREEKLRSDFVEKVKRREEEFQREEMMMFSKYNSIFRELVLQENELKEKKQNLQKEIVAFRQRVMTSNCKQRVPSTYSK
ncbi:septin-10-like [Uloborus diversus]|uniref:septin-10-like n=1 Tax=Uloborus diversus TaxID=327109 RepID=UPI002409B7FA|nr:septin-10-like [Uloborus diversus]